MRIRTLLPLLAAASFSTSAIGAGGTKTNDVILENYGGWTDCLVMRGGDCKTVVVPAVGGRVLSYAINGENILFENPEALGRTFLNSSNDFWVGGYQCDIGPEVRGIPEHKWLWNGPW